MSGLAWLTQRPVAHRGLHDTASGIIENTPSAVMAATEAGYGIEVDLQITQDGEAMVYHDDALGRLTEGEAPLATLTAAALKRVAFRATGDRMITLAELCEAVAGRVPLVIELKSRFDGDMRLPARATTVLAAYRGQAAVMSFDPAQIAALRALAPGLPRGLVAERHDWPGRDGAGLTQRALAYGWQALQARPQFLAYNVDDLACPLPRLARAAGLPLLTWTVRTPQDRARAARYADQIIFEGWRP